MTDLESLLQNVDPRALLRQLEAEEAKQSCRTFIERYIQIESHTAGALSAPFRLWPGQVNALDTFCSSKLTVVLKARQLGLSWLALSYALWNLWRRPGFNCMVMSRGETEAKEMTRRVEFMLRHMPDWLVVPGARPTGAIPSWESTTSTITVHHPGGFDSVLQSLPASPNSGRSFTADLIILDEHGFQTWARDIWAAIFPSINRPSGGQAILISTIERGTLFEEIWTGSPTNGFTPVFLPWSTDPSRDEAWYAKTLMALGEVKTLAEYPSTPEEALATPGGAMFPELRPTTHVISPREIPSWYRRYVGIDFGLDALAAVWLALDEAGKAIVYRELEIPNLTYSQASAALLDANAGDTIVSWYAPPDLWGRSRESGRRAAELFAQGGVYFSRSVSDRVQGWGITREWLLPRVTRSEAGGEMLIPDLRFLDTCPRLWHCMSAIQRDRRIIGDAAVDPHNITHLPDALRYALIMLRAAPSQRPAPPRPTLPWALQTPAPHTNGVIEW